MHHIQNSIVLGIWRWGQSKSEHTRCRDSLLILMHSSILKTLKRTAPKSLQKPSSTVPQYRIQRPPLHLPQVLRLGDSNPPMGHSLQLSSKFSQGLALSLIWKVVVVTAHRGHVSGLQSLQNQSLMHSNQLSCRLLNSFTHTCEHDVTCCILQHCYGISH